MNQTLTAALAFMIPLGVTAQDIQTDTDKTDTHLTDEVVVTGTKPQTDVRHLSQSVSVVNRSAIEQSMQTSLLPLLTDQVPGLFATARGVMGYGVSGGASGAISLRGISGASGRLMVLIDGHPQYMGLMGHPIADVYQSYMADRVEVLRGPASVLYGSNAMGGVVNIVTRQMHDDGMRTRLHAGYGSYNTLETEATSLLRSGKFSSAIGLSYNRTDGHRTGMGFEQFGGFAKLGYDISASWKMRAAVDVTHFNASQPGSVSAPLTDADQSVTRGEASLSVENTYRRSSGAVSLFYNWGNHWINDGYSAIAGSGAAPQLYRFDSHDDMMGASVYQTASLFEGNRITVGADYFHFGGMAWNRYVEGTRAGQTDKLVDKALDETAAYIDIRQHIRHWATLNAGLRADHHSEVGTEWVPQVGVAFHLPRAIELKASAVKGFRYPTIRERYMFPPQNPDLQAESLWNYELAFSQRLREGRFSYGVNVFYIDGKNMITTVPRQGATPLNMNTGAVKNSGVELLASYRPADAWTVTGNYSFLHMDNPVVAAPEHKLYAGFGYRKGLWNISSGLQYIHGLYTSTSPEEKESFVLWNARVGYRFNPWLHIWIKGENLLAQRYEINAGYPMPKATAMVGFNIEI